MARYRYEYIQKKKSESGQSGEATYDLPESGFMPELVITAYSTPTASTDPALPLSEAITKIEVVDGSKTIKSLTGNQAQALAMFHGSSRFASPQVNDNAVEGHDVFTLNMGGVFGNTLYAPNMSAFSNPQLKISWDYSLTTGARGATYDADASPSMKFTALAKLYEGEGLYTHGYVQSQETYTFTQAASTTTQVEIPRGNPLVGIGVEAGYVSTNYTDDVNKLKLDFNNGEWTPLKLEADEVIDLQRQLFPDGFEVSFKNDLIDAVEIDAHMGYITDISLQALASGGRSLAWLGGSQGVAATDFTDVATPTAISTYEQVAVAARGLCPFGVSYIPMSALAGAGVDTISTADFKRIILELTSSASASTSSTPSVLTEYLITV